MPARAAFAAALALVLAPLSTVRGQSLEDLRVGSWVEVRGELAPDGRFHASGIEVLAPDNLEALVGTVRRVDAAGETFVLLGRTVRVSDRTQWQETSLRSLEGARVKVQGHWRGALFSARKIAPRNPGRDRIEGRVDQLQRNERGFELEVQGLVVLLPRDAKLENDRPFSDLPLAPEVEREVAGGHTLEQEEDYIPASVRFSDQLSFGALIESKLEHEDDFDLDRARSGDKTKLRVSFKGQLVWVPSESFHAAATARYEFDQVDRTAGPDEFTGNPHLEELWGYWEDAAGLGFDLQLGRQDFDDERQWLYKRKLDAARLIWGRPGVRLDLSASTLLFDGSGTEEADNLIAYLSNGDPRRELAAYVIDRRDDHLARDEPIWFGARAYGAWVPQNKVWAEASLLRGFSNNINLRGSALDLGTTWSPPWSGPLSFTAGWAYASGDDPSSSGTDESFRQTGLQRNKDRWAGVSNFRYYGELLDPELSNLTIFTLGVGARVAPRTSLDLAWHRYRQVDASPFLRNASVRTAPDGSHEDLGQELDLILGCKALKGWDFVLIGGWFRPGESFPGADSATLGSVLVRFRF